MLGLRQNFPLATEDVAHLKAGMKIMAAAQILQRSVGACRVQESVQMPAGPLLVLGAVKISDKGDHSIQVG